ncbi:toll/interleukin-1 receptor domain-containing protein [Cyanothece sp. BG0011]|uniref:toll/interleukin-1 receptor domain-containing protein n=1 Tax=Cyanothece sp. BG0011 TaxID=2082950 RepID=UPI000D1EB699|nr:toll/interleukin-1 receptor domain-containing protein [Cyanothece sp. BG0011]
MSNLYQPVYLTQDFPKYNLKKGDTAILVDIVPHPQQGEDGYVLEICEDKNDSINIVIVPKSTVKMMTNTEIFISYAWGGDSETLTNELDNAFQAKGITIIRDKRDLGYKGLIKEFMQRIGQGKCIIVVLSDKYLKSKNCMFELIEIAKNGEFYDRIFPIVLRDARIYDDLERLDYLQHWEQEKTKLQEKYKQIDLANSSKIMESLNLYDEIRRNIDNLTDTLKNMNTLNTKMHQESDFEEIIKAIETRLNEK